jgi:hypothetical protein
MYWCNSFKHISMGNLQETSTAIFCTATLCQNTIIQIRLLYVDCHVTFSKWNDRIRIFNSAVLHVKTWAPILLMNSYAICGIELLSNKISGHLSTGTLMLSCILTMTSSGACNIAMQTTAYQLGLLNHYTIFLFTNVLNLYPWMKLVSSFSTSYLDISNKKVPLVLKTCQTYDAKISSDCSFAMGSTFGSRLVVIFPASVGL